MLYPLLKRAMDIVGSALGLAFFSPVVLVLSRKIRKEMGPPAIFSQMRAGRDGKPFRLYKFRTMTDERGEDGEPLPDEARLTKLGARLRASSLDELPQLWNVLRGDMSLVGPRPLLLDYVPLYNNHERRRLGVPPGVTGWAQVNGRNALTWPEKFALDVWYAENKSLALDVRILLLTIRAALRREGISAAGEATMPRFMGSANNQNLSRDGAEMQETILQAVRSVLGDDTDESATMANTPSWDSLKTLQIVMALDEEGVSIPFERIAEIKSVADIVSFAER